MIGVLMSLGLLVLAYLWGGAVERNHLDDLVRRENAARGMPTVTLRTPPADWEVTDGRMVTGSVVISIDYFKRFVAGISMVFGGRLRSIEPLLERARREAIQRMREQARDAGYQAVINVRVETATLASMVTDKSVAGVEVLAFGTAVRLGAPATIR